MRTVKIQNGNPSPPQDAVGNLKRRFVREKVIQEVTGIGVKKLQRDRWAGTGDFPHYKVGGVVLYDLDECLAIIEATRRTSTSDSG